MMRPAGMVDYIVRYGSEVANLDAQHLRWKHETESDDIVKWRPAQ